LSTPGVGIKITSPTGVGPQGGPEQVIFTTKYPFAKLDTQLGVDLTTDPPQGPVSFQNISIFFNTDPPNPASGTLTTLVYSFAHGYDYVPTYWVLFRNDNASNSDAAATYGNEGSVIASTSTLTYAQLLVTVTKTHFNVFVLKSRDPLDPGPQNIVGYTIKLRTYIFTDPVIN
jgi:hypothetical protein